MLSALNGPEDWILRYIRTCLYFYKRFVRDRTEMMATLTGTHQDFVESVSA